MTDDLDKLLGLGNHSEAPAVVLGAVQEPPTHVVVYRDHFGPSIVTVRGSATCEAEKQKLADYTIEFAGSIPSGALQSVLHFKDASGTERDQKMPALLAQLKGEATA